jgi:hypothetical protein
LPLKGSLGAQCGFAPSRIECIRIIGIELTMYKRKNILYLLGQQIKFCCPLKIILYKKALQLLANCKAYIASIQFPAADLGTDHSHKNLLYSIPVRRKVF